MASFILVSHRMDEVVGISDRVYVVKDGQVVDIVKKGKARIDSIQHRLVGRDVDKEYYREQRQLPCDAQTVLVEIRGIALPGWVVGINLTLHAEEVLCLVGVEGLGGEAVLRTIYGMRTPIKGQVGINGQKVTAFPPRSAVAQGVGYVPHERKIEGIVAGMNVYENITLSQMGQYSLGGGSRIAGERALARDWIAKLSIKDSRELADCGNLAGGNQQRVALAQWLSGQRALNMDATQRDAVFNWMIGRTWGVPNELFIAAVLLIGALFIERRTTLGRALKALGAGETATAASEINVARDKLLAFEILGGVAAVAGLILAVKLSGGTPLTGGVSGVLNTAIGTRIVAVIRASMLYFEVYATQQQMVFCIVLIAAIALMIDRSRLRCVKSPCAHRHRAVHACELSDRPDRRGI